MSEKQSEFMYQNDLDDLIRGTSIVDVFAFYGHQFPEKRSGNNLRMPCPIDGCEPSSYGQLSVNTSPPYFMKCHTCGVHGHIMTLMWMLKHRRPTTGGGVPKGDEYREILEDLRTIQGYEPSDAPRRSELSPSVAGEKAAAESESVTLRNTPLARSDNERVRDLVQLPDQLVSDVAEMSPAASRYFRSRPYLTPEMCRKWTVGYLPSSAKGTMRGRITYGIESESGELLAFAGRDPDYEAKRSKWLRNQSDPEPIKYRFPTAKYFRRGLELYGQQARRIAEEGYGDKIAEIGVLVVEGMNDVLRLDAEGVPAVALMSNDVTDEQVAKIVRWARQLASGRVSLMLDNDDQGREGAKSTLWKIARHTPALVVDYAAQQPEQLSSEEIEAICQEVRTRWKLSSP